ncbi:hypothetical protein MMC25_000358 [Agyrium rufum]|nr:hypothetical protein [Agyrium rufum]
MSVIFIILQVALATLITRGLYLRYLHPLARFPGPSLAAVTNYWKTQAFFGGQHHLVEQKLHDEYGPVIRVGPNSLSISSLAGFEAIYGFHKSIEKGDFYAFGRDAKTHAGSIFTARSDAAHREHRKKVVGPALSTTKIASYEPVVEKHVAVLHSRISGVAGSNGQSKAFDVAPLIHRFTFDTLNDIIYGDAISSEPYTDLKVSAGILEALRKISKMSWGCNLLPWLGRLMRTAPMVALMRKPTFDEDGNMNGIAALAAQTQDLILAHPEKALESRSPSILKNWLQVPESSSTRMNWKEMAREGLNLTFAGPGSSAAALTSIVMMLGKHDGRKWQERIRNELKDGKAPSSSPALMAVVKETLRLHAPFPTAFPRTIAPGAEDALADITGPLPVGTTVSANTFVLGQSKEVWGEDAWDWKPERWLVEPAEAKKLDEKFVAFSKGPRLCIGKDIVMMMIGLAVSDLLRKWDIVFEGKVEAHNYLEMQYWWCKITLLDVGRM